MSDEFQPDSQNPRPGERSLMRRRRAALGYDGRSERRALRGAARRRKMRTRLWLVTVPVVIVIALAVVLLVLFGGPKGEQRTSAVSTTVQASMSEGELLVVTQDDGAQGAIIFESHDGNGFVLVVPGITLLRNGDAFQTVSQIYGAGGDKALTSVLDGAFGAHLSRVSTVSWAALQGALSSAGIADAPAALQTEQDAQQLAAAFTKLTAGGAAAKIGSLWQGVELAGDSSDFVGFLMSAAKADNQWTSLAVVGTVVQGEGFTYLEPQVAVARALLSGTPGDAAITVQLENGSGEVGAVEGAAAQLQPLGYKVTPAGNAEDFPNVSQTRIVFATGGDQAAARIKAMLGVGAVSEDPTLGPNQIVVVLGADYVPPVPTSENSTG